MKAGVRITVKNFLPVREYRQDDVQVKIWTGTKWTYLSWWPYTPDIAERCDIKPHEKSVTIEFPASGVVPLDRLVYLQKVLPRLRRMGLAQ